MSYINNGSNETRLFRNRLINLMLINQIKSASDLAEELFKTKLLTRRYDNEKVFPLKKDSIEKTVQKHMSEKCNPDELPKSLTASYVKAYSQVFNCSPDYLLGNTDVISPDLTVRALVENIGLSEKSIKNLTYLAKADFSILYTGMLPDEFRDMLNEIIGSDEFKKIILKTAKLKSTYNETCEADESELENYQKEAWNSLTSKIGKSRLDHAVDLYKKKESDPYDDNLNPSEEELSDYSLVDEVIEEISSRNLDIYGKKDRKIETLKICRYDLNTSITNFICKLFPDDNDMDLE